MGEKPEAQAVIEPGPAYPAPRAGFWGANPGQMDEGDPDRLADIIGVGRGSGHHPAVPPGSDTLPPLGPPPCAYRKYLRDADRQVLAQRAFILTVKVLEDTLSELAEVRSWQPLSSPRWWLRPPFTHECP